MLRAEDIEVGYGRATVLRGVSIGVQAGELVVLLGANGAGKTTTLRALSGLLAPAAGTITAGDEDLTGATPDRFVGAGIAHIPEGAGTFGRLSVSENLKMGLYPRRRRRTAKTGINRTAAIEQALDRFPILRERLRQRAGSLSGGEQQMLAVARALVGDPKILLVDEPSHGLGPRVVDSLFGLFDELRASGLGILVVEQEAAPALANADRVFVLERGRVGYEGDAASILGDRARLARAYLGAGSR